MEMEVESRNVETEIESRMAELVHGRVTLTKNSHHKRLANVVEAIIVVTLPGRQTMTSRKKDKTFKEAIRTAFDAMVIELNKNCERRSPPETLACDRGEGRDMDTTNSTSSRVRS
jgi:hypothetical protein